MEKARDRVRKKLAKVYPHFSFGSYTSIEQIFEAIFSTNEVIYETQLQCPENHKIQHLEQYSLYMIKANAPFILTSEWMQINMYEGSNHYHICKQTVNVNTTFITIPPMIVLEFSNSNIKIDHFFEINKDDQIYRYELAGVIYYRDTDKHFFSNIITADKQLWFYDGISTGSQMVYMGSLVESLSLTTYRDGLASAAFYILV